MSALTSRLATPALAALLLLPSCAMRTIVANSMTGLLEEVEGQYVQEPSYLYGREAGASLLKMLDGVIASSPHNEDLLGMGARMGAQFALAFAEDEDEDYAASLYAKAKGYGLRALDDDELDAALDENDAAVRDALQNFDEDDVPVLFWTGLAYGSWINLNLDSIRAVADLPIALAFIERVLELDPSYHHGSAYLFLGQYHGSRGSELGGSPNLAREAFEQALAVSDRRFLLAQVFMARFYAVPTQNRELFDALLEEVLDAPDDILPGEELTTAVAKHKADELYLTGDDLFIEG